MVGGVESTAHECRPSLKLPGPSRTRAGAAVASVGVSLPANVVSSATIGDRLGVSEEWIERRTGIHARHMADPDERLAAHAAAAARVALDRAGVDPVDVDLVLVATTTSDEVLPNAAPLVCSTGSPHASCRTWPGSRPGTRSCAHTPPSCAASSST